MKNLLIAGNWKSNKTTSESESWLSDFKNNLNSDTLPIAMTIILFVPFTLLDFVKKRSKELNLPLNLGAQNLSPFSDGAYTGEISGRMLQEFADWVTIGHSERRTHFGESEEMLKQKVKQAKAAGLKIIYGVPDEKTVVPEGVTVIAYEPPAAIGVGGVAEDPISANRVMEVIKSQYSSSLVKMIYGGSVNPENIAQFVKQPSIDGILAGRASLDPVFFADLIKRSLIS